MSAAGVAAAAVLAMASINDRAAIGAPAPEAMAVPGRKGGGARSGPRGLAGLRRAGASVSARLVCGRKKGRSSPRLPGGGRFLTT